MGGAVGTIDDDTKAFKGKILRKAFQKKPDITLSGILILGAFSFPMVLAGFVLNGVGRALSSGALDAWFIDALQAADPDMP